MELSSLTETSFILLGMMQKPVHGYEMMENVNQYFKGQFRIGPATLYTALKQLHKSKLCQIEVEGKRKIYTLTESGLALFNEAKTLKKAMLKFIDEVGK
jgi:DNA-binding PadR family transcriptional regulator